MRPPRAHTAHRARAHRRCRRWQVVAPFGGFFASGIKRAYKLDDFASIIPGHGGVFDRVDCQLIMGLATQIYYTTFIGAGAISIARARLFRGRVDGQ